MAIHHTHIKKAQKAGYILEQVDGDMVRAFLPAKALAVFGASSGDAMAQMQAAMVIHNDNYRVKAVADGSRMVNITRVADGHVMANVVPVDAHRAIIITGDAEFTDPTPFTTEPSAAEIAALAPATGGDYFAEDGTLMHADGTRSIFDDVDEDGTEGEEHPDAYVDGHDGGPAPKVEIERSSSGIALDGAVAYREGTPSGDCPFSSEEENEDTEENDEYERFLKWNEEWDAAADAAEEEKADKGGSVVSEKYRAKYAELGHPTHCGDDLAELLNNLCLTKAGTDLDRFETICQANGVDTSKYRRSGVGWQGRIRMTGRNLLAKQVYLKGGVVLTPVDGAEPSYQMSADWMASQRFKMPKADQAKPIPAAEPAV